MCKSEKTLNWVKNAINIHGDKYIYDNTNYIDALTKLDIICKIHGNFKQRPSSHLNGSGCKKCGILEMNKKNIVKASNLFIAKSIKIHGEKYNYDKVLYTHSQESVIITCKKHGDFKQIPTNHLEGKGCKNCGNNKNTELMGKSIHTTKSFIEKAKLVHGDKYNYDETFYVTYNEKMIIKCPIHGIFHQTYRHHLDGSGCKKCGIISKSNTIINKHKLLFFEKVSKIHHDKYIYHDDYTHSEEQIKITCKIHGDFYQSAHNHLAGSGCNKCGIKKQIEKNSLSKEEFFNRIFNIHGNKYGYSKINYINTNEKIIIECLEHGNFEQIAHNHLQGKGCPQCSNFGQPSKAEQEIVDYLKSLSINNIIISDKSILSGKEIDIYLPDHKLAIEFNGLYWHSENKKENKNYHLEKTNKCNNLDIQLIHIFEDEWLNKQEIVKSRLCNLLNKNTNKIYGRETIVKLIDSKQYRTFLDNNHLQGFVAGKIYLGLFYKSKETDKEYLVSVMSFGSLRKNLGNTHKDNQYELLRFANSKFINVIGGASKLLKYFEKHYKPEYIISYADKRWSKGNLYQQLKFELIRESIPNYFYVKGLKRENRFNYRKDILISKYGCSPNMTENQFMSEIMKMNRIYDCGNYVFEKLYLR